MPHDDEGHPYHFRLFGFPVHVGWQFFLFPVWSVADRDAGGAVTWIAVVFLSVLVHELGHALAFRAFGSPARIQLWGMGGLTWGRPPPRRWQDVVVTAAGPVPPLLLIGLPAILALRAGVGDDNPALEQALADVVWANLFWSIVNLLPILPMDGGRLVDALWGRAPARVLSTVVGVGVAVLAAVAQIPFYIFVGVAIAGYNAWKLNQERRAGLTADPVRALAHEADPGGGAGTVAEGPSAGGIAGRAWASLELGQVDEAARQLALVADPPALLRGAVAAAQGTPSTAVTDYAVGLRAGVEVPPVADQVLARSGLAQAVARALAALGDDPAIAALDRLRVRLADRGHPAVAAEVAEELAGDAPAERAGVAWYEVGRAWSRAGDPERAMAALRRSAAAGHARAETVVADPAFTRAFDDEAFAAAVRTLG